MLDEPSAGSPVLVDRVLAAVGRLRDAGTAVLVEQLIEKALALADRVYALARGSIVLEAAAASPTPDPPEQAYSAMPTRRRPPPEGGDAP
jgi:branched-chain amino acid transport system ATP-binding protein